MSLTIINLINVETLFNHSVKVEENWPNSKYKKFREFRTKFQRMTDASIAKVINAEQYLANTCIGIV